MWLFKLWLTLDLLSLLIIVVFLFDSYILDGEYLYKYSKIVDWAVYFFLSSIAIYGVTIFAFALYTFGVS